MIPEVSIGVPTYNGDKFLRKSLESVLSQSYHNFEVIISDNCSTDRTEVICRHYASLDARIKYFKNKKNYGAAWNYNRVFELSKGKYFKWAPDDDLCAETFLEECLDVLKNDQKAVLAFTHTPHIDLKGNVLGRAELGQYLGGQIPAYDRLKNLICYEFGGDCRPVVGLIRSDVLRQTKLIGSYPGSDQTLLVELTLRGHFIEIPKQLQFRRKHPPGTERHYANRRERAEWFKGRKNNRFAYPQWRVCFEFIKAIQAAPVPKRERFLCYKEILRWLRWGHAKMMIDDLKFNSHGLLRKHQ